MTHAIGMVAIALAVVAANILFTKFMFGKRYEDASKKEKNFMDAISLCVMVALFIVYIVLISNI
jgi:hypothetical protein